MYKTTGEMAEKMTVSVIIPTYNGAHKIMGVLRSLEKQTRMPDEVIVVIDGSVDDTAEMLRSRDFALAGLKIIEQENGGRSKVRNRGAKEAKGELLIFFDDDMAPEPECVAIHLTHHQNHPGTILTGAQVDPRDCSLTDFQLFKNYLSNHWFEKIKGKKNKPMSGDAIFLTAANFSILKKIFETIDGFDERLTDAEDYDLAVRAQLLGISLYYDHEAFAWHNDPVTCMSYVKRLRQYTQAHKKLNELKPALYGAANKYSVVKPTGLKGFFFQLFCHRFWISSVDKGYCKWLPMKLRYKLYDWIVTANGNFYPEKIQLK